MNMKRFKPGDIVKHFKRELPCDCTDQNMYLYIVLGEAIDTVTDKPVVIYKALYGAMIVYTRPLEEFESKVNNKKYPNIEQEYIFEKVEGSVII